MNRLTKVHGADTFVHNLHLGTDLRLYNPSCNDRFFQERSFESRNHAFETKNNVTILFNVTVNAKVLIVVTVT